MNLFDENPVTPPAASPSNVFGPPATSQAAPTPSSPIASSHQSSSQANQTAAINFGEVIEKFPIPRFKFTSTEKKEIFVMLSQKIQPLRYHYFENLGYVSCTGGICCRQSKGVSPVKYGVAVFRIESDSKGVMIPPFRGEPRVIQFAESTYVSFCDKAADYPNFYNRIFKVACTDTKYQKLDISVLEQVPAELMSIVEDSRRYVTQNFSSIRAVFSREVSEAELIERFGSEAPALNDSAFTG